MNKPKKIRRKIGDVLYIDLGDGNHSYAHVTTDPCIIFYEGRFIDNLDISAIIQLPELFRIFVYKSAIADGTWPVIGNSKLTDGQLEIPYMFKKDALSGKLFIYHSDFAATDYERPASLDECKGLERAAVWDPSHVVSRLNDHYANVPNKWVQQLSL